MFALLLSAPLLAQGVALGLQQHFVQEALPQEQPVLSGVGVQSVLHFTVQQQEAPAAASGLTGPAHMPSSTAASNEGDADDGDRRREEDAEVTMKERRHVAVETRFEALKERVLSEGAQDAPLETRFESLKKHISKNSATHLRRTKPTQVERLAFSLHRVQGLTPQNLNGLDKHMYCALVTATNLDPAGVAVAVCKLCQTTSSVPAFCPGSTAKTGWQRARMVCAEANVAAAPSSDCEFNEQNAQHCPKTYYGAASTQLLATGQPSACVRQSASTCSRNPPLGTGDCCRLSESVPSQSDLGNFATTFRAANALQVGGNALQRTRNACHRWLQVDLKEGMQACQAVYAFPSAVRVLRLIANVAALAVSAPVRNAAFGNETRVSFAGVPECDETPPPGHSHGKGDHNGTACNLYTAYAEVGGFLPKLDEACSPIGTKAMQQQASPPPPPPPLVPPDPPPCRNDGTSSFPASGCHDATSKQCASSALVRKACRLNCGLCALPPPSPPAAASHEVSAGNNVSCTLSSCMPTPLLSPTPHPHMDALDIDGSDSETANDALGAGAFPKDLEVQRANTSDSPPEGDSDEYDDPIIQTLEGEDYFMHGVGVFEYASAGGIESQVYLCPFAACTAVMMRQGECPTFIGAVAVRTHDHTITMRGSAMHLDGHRQKPLDGMVGSIVYQGEDLTVTATAALSTELHALTPVDPSREQPRIAHELRRSCNRIHGEESSHTCGRVGWRLRTEEISIDVGVVGPYEQGWLNEGVSDRTFLLNVTGVKDGASLRGLINGAKTSPTYFNVLESDVIFPAYQKEEMDAQCGAGQALRLLKATGALSGDIRRFREPPAVSYAVSDPYAQMRH